MPLNIAIPTTLAISTSLIIFGNDEDKRKESA
jgi:hypothetical protein